MFLLKIHWFDWFFSGFRIVFKEFCPFDKCLSRFPENTLYSVSARPHFERFSCALQICTVSGPAGARGRPSNFRFLILGASWGHLEGMWGHLGAKRALGTGTVKIQVPVPPASSPSRANSRPILRPSWGYLGPYWANLGPVMAYPVSSKRATRGHVQSMSLSLGCLQNHSDAWE